MGLKLAAASGGSIELNPTNTASNFTITVPAKTGTMAMDGPAFSASGGTVTSLSSSTETKVLFDTEEYDTNNNFASSRFTPTVAGYYQINAAVRINALIGNTAYTIIYKNGSAYKIGTLSLLPASGGPIYTISSLVYCNGSTDYIEIYAFQNSGVSQNTGTGSTVTWFNGSMVRGA